MGVVLAAKGDVIAIHGYKPMIGKGHAVGITGPVRKHVLGPAQGSLGVNDPVFPKPSAQEGGEWLLLGQRLTRAMEGKLLSRKSPPPSSHELAANNAAEYSHR
jgi:hypothetical protein